MFGGDIPEHGLTDMLGDEFLQGLGIAHRIAADDVENVASADDVPGRNGSVDLPQLRIVLRPQKSEGRSEGTGADPGDGTEFRPRAGRCPAHQQASAKGAVLTATGNGKDIRLDGPGCG